MPQRLAELLAYSSGETLITHGRGLDTELGGGRTGLRQSCDLQKYVTADFWRTWAARGRRRHDHSPDIAKFRRVAGVGAQHPNVRRCPDHPRRCLRSCVEAAASHAQSVLAIDSLKTRQSEGREPFSHGVLKIGLRLRAIGGADPVRGYDGTSVDGCASLTWNVDRARIAHGHNQKTGTKINPPIHPDFLSWLSQQPSAIGSPVFHSLAGVGTGGSGLSHQFRMIMRGLLGLRRKSSRLTATGTQPQQKFSQSETFLSASWQLAMLPAICGKRCAHATGTVMRNTRAAN